MACRKNWRQVTVILMLAFGVRLALLLLTPGNTDIQLYKNVADIVGQRGIATLYAETPGLYPYPPVWVIVQVFAAKLAQSLGGSFSLYVRFPIVLADVSIVAILAAWQAKDPSGTRFWAAFLYAVNPVALIVTCLHGQFDAIPIAFLLLATFWLALYGRSTYSGWALACAIAVKGFPVLFVPLHAAYETSNRARIKLIGVAMIPVLVLLLPFALRSPSALIMELFGYRGSALLGFMVPIRSIYVPLAHSSVPVDVTMEAIRFSAYTFLVAYAVYMLLVWRRRPMLLEDTVVIFALFYALYAGIAPQYTLWILPFLLLTHLRLALLYTATTTAALVGFYLYAVPSTLPFITQTPHWLAQVLYAVGGTSWWLTVVAILLLVLRSIYAVQRPVPAPPVRTAVAGHALR